MCQQGRNLKLLPCCCVAKILQRNENKFTWPNCTMDLAECFCNCQNYVLLQKLFISVHSSMDNFSLVFCSVKLGSCTIVFHYTPLSRPHVREGQCILLLNLSTNIQIQGSIINYRMSHIWGNKKNICHSPNTVCLYTRLIRTAWKNNTVQI